MRLFDPRDLHVGGSGSSDTDAVRPTGETGARCPWCGSEMQARMRENARHSVTGAIVVENPWLFECSNEDCPSIIWYPTWAAALAAAARRLEPDEGAGNDAGSSVEGLGLQPRMLGSPEATDAGARSAPRPLPDFPAGARTVIKWRSIDGVFERQNHIYLPGGGTRHVSAEEWKLLVILQERGVIWLCDCDNPEDVAEAHKILSSVNTAPARPAAAGLTDIPEVTLESDGQWISDWWKTGHKFTPPLGVLMDFMDAYRKRLAESILSSRATGVTIEGEGLEYLASVAHKAYLDACSRLGWEVKPENRVCYDLLSENAKELDREMVRQVLAASRATGAEVEIAIPEPIDDEITAFAMSSETGYGNMSHWFNHRWFRAGIEYARRHATIREKK